MATKLLTLASFAILTLSVACQVAPVEPRRESLSPVVISAPAPTIALSPALVVAPLELAAPALAQETAATPPEKALTPPKARRPRPAALLTPSPTPMVVAPTAAIEVPANVPAMSAEIREVATPRVDKDDRPATGNVVSRRANNR